MENMSVADGLMRIEGDDVMFLLSVSNFGSIYLANTIVCLLCGK